MQCRAELKDYGRIRVGVLRQRSMDNSIEIPLDLPDVRVLSVDKTDDGHWLIRIESTLERTAWAWFSFGRF